MKSYKIHGIVLLTVFAFVAVGPKSLAQTIAGEDFDGGTTNGGFTATSLATYEGDFEVGVKFTDWDDHDNTYNGIFDFGSGSPFDRFGTVNPTVLNTPDNGFPNLTSDYIDDSDHTDPNKIFAADRLGVQRGGVNNSGFGLADTCNGNNITGNSSSCNVAQATANPNGSVSAQWTFDVSSGSNMQMSIDFAAFGAFDVLGGFETTDFMTFTYQIDGGPVQTAFDVRPQTDINGNATGEYYTVTMDNGMVYDRYFSPFFNASVWDALLTIGPSLSRDWHPDDLDEDGYIDVEGAFGIEATRAYYSNPFDEVEFETHQNPLYVNGTTPLDNNLKTITVPIVGSGSVLTLKLLAVEDGSLEYMFFDNMLIEEVPAYDADFNDDGFVDGDDFLYWQRGESPDPSSAGDLALWEAQYGGPPPLAAAVAVPEPASVLLFCFGLAAIPTAMRRHRQDVS